METGDLISGKRPRGPSIGPNPLAKTAPVGVPAAATGRGQNLPFALDIIDVAFGGKGIGKVDGKTWFVEGAVPGDRLTVAPVQDCGRYGDAAVLQVLESSPLRTEVPQCPHHAVCGGCQWQEVSYGEQLKWKQKFVESALKRIGKLEQDVPVTVLPSEEIYGYRNRVLLRVHLTPPGDKKQGSTDDSLNSMTAHSCAVPHEKKAEKPLDTVHPDVTAGYFARGTRQLVPIQSCAIASPVINRLIDAVRRSLFSGLSGRCTFRLEIQELPPLEPERAAPQVLVTVFPGEGEKGDFRKVADHLRGLPEVSWCDLVFAVKDAPFQSYDRQDGITYGTRPGLFQQVNLRHNHTLRSLVKEWVMAKKPSSVLDLFCGSGNLSLSLLREVSYVEGLELSPGSILGTQFNVLSNHLPHERANYLAGDGEKHLWKCARKGEKFDLVILDPPRQGFYKGVVPLKMLAPQSILYVSCDPSTLARDLSYLCRNGDYRIEKIVALDFFPHTYHIETMVMLEKSS